MKVQHSSRPEIHFFPIVSVGKPLSRSREVAFSYTQEVSYVPPTSATQSLAHPLS